MRCWANGTIGRVLLVGVLAVTGLDGCSGWLSRPDVRLDRPLQEATADQLLALLEERAAAIRSLKGLFRAHIQGPGIPATQQVEGAVYYQRPDALRLQGFNRLGMKLFEVALGADRYRVRLVNGQVLSGSLSELHRVERVARPFQLSVLAMTGVIGTPAVPKDDRIVLSDEGDRYRLDVYAPGASLTSGPYRQIWFDRRLLQVVRDDRLAPTGELEATVQFDDFRAVDLAPHEGEAPDRTGVHEQPLRPFRIHARDGQGQSRIQLMFHELIPNAPVTAEELQIAQWSEPRG
ncbi:LolA family protein [Candidatus Nitrospira bockiana]